VTAGFVRAARSADAAGLARVQVASWRASLAGLVPDAVLAELTSVDAEKQWAERWLSAIVSPPTTSPKAGRCITGYSTPGGVSTSPKPARDQ